MIPKIEVFSDGTSNGTHVHIDGRPIPVTRIVLECPGPGSVVGKLTLEIPLYRGYEDGTEKILYDPAIDVTADVTFAEQKKQLEPETKRLCFVGTGEKSRTRVYDSDDEAVNHVRSVRIEIDRDNVKAEAVGLRMRKIA